MVATRELTKPVYTTMHAWEAAALGVQLALVFARLFWPWARA